MLIWIGFVFLLVGWTPGRIEHEYYMSASRAMAAGRFGPARVAFERLLQWRPRTRTRTCSVWPESQGLGQAEEAASLLGGLAPLDSTGFAPAHL